ncbi:DUF4892 domain-containing protein [Mangrovitalea sediminis]|uniref:DUF4892 domain-containing protein n=1 Tax=Mangrovitalea sediminis TaxID=1982043 RepID=UPI000BE518A9|nr:DUF4892 domain-containing protein [Mangrovitalea sediminis]
MKWHVLKTAAFTVRSLMVWGALLLSLPAFASPPPVPAFPGATQTSETSVKDADYRIFLSSVKQINDELRGDRVIRVPVEGRVRFYRINQDDSPTRVVEHYQTWLRDHRAQMLFGCDGRDCGPSRLWANQVFQTADLYGSDDQQYYRVALWRDAQGQRVLSVIYVVRRGDLGIRVRVGELLLPPKAVLPGITAEEGRRIGPIVVPWHGGLTTHFDLDVETTRELKALADKYPQAEFVVVGYTALDQQSLSQMMARARQAANAFADLLQARGIDRSRIQVVPVGPVIPIQESGRSGNRVEIVLIRKGGADS